MAEKHFYEQEKYTNEYLIPYLNENLETFKDTNIKILEVGSAEGGTLSILDSLGYEIDGIEISQPRVDIALKKLKPEIIVSTGDITTKIDTDKKGYYDLIIMRDVIEHIEDKQAAFDNINSLLSEKGHLFVTFPLKYSAYAGHQQNYKSWIKYVIFISLLPDFVIKFLHKITGENDRLDNLLYTKRCTLSYFRFKKLVKEKWSTHHIGFFLLRPVYKQRFGWPIVKNLNIPFFREFSNGCEVILKKK